MMNAHWPAPMEHPPLAASDAHVWRVPLDDFPTLDSLNGNVLSPDERERAEQFRIDAARHCFVASRFALRMLLGRYLQIESADIRFTSSGIGKPQLHDRHRSRDVRFNVAHSGSLALIAFTIGCEIGVDIEKLRVVNHSEQIAHRYFHQDELDTIRATPPAARDTVFLRCWTAKEALLKALGTGITDSLAEFAVPLQGSIERAVAIDVPDRSSASVSRCWLQPLDPGDDFVAAFATVGAKRDPVLFSFMP
jgi:4'-phosphopantetheinyl transferase